MNGVTIVGLGNIGSALVLLLARQRKILRILLIDPDRYELKNVAGQAIDRAAVGRLKAEYQAERIREINPDIEAIPFAEPVENLALLEMRGTVLVGCVDNRRARQAINQAAWRLGSPYLDAAVGEPALARFTLYRPLTDGPCLECGWSQQAYEQLEQIYPCSPDAPRAPATDAPAELGALAAVLLAAELRKLTGAARGKAAPGGTQLVFDLEAHACSRMHYRFNPDCRFDHLSWRPLNSGLDPCSTSLDELFDFVGGDDPRIALEGHDFASHLDCSGCGRRRGVGLKLPRRLELACDSCGARLFAPGFYTLPSLQRSDLSPALRALRLAAIGLRRGDVLSVRRASGECEHLALGAGGRDD